MKSPRVAEASNLRKAVMDYKLSVADMFFDSVQKNDVELLAELRHFSYGSKKSGFHIVHICTELAPVVEVGSLASYVTGLSSALQKKSHFVEVILPKVITSLVDDRARRVSERVVTLRQEHLEQQEENGEVIDDSQIFIEAAKGKRTDRVYGIGSVASLVCSNNTATSAPPPSDAYTAQLEKELTTLKEQFGIMQEEVTHLRQVNQQHDEQVRELIREMIPNLPTNQPGQSSDQSRQSDSDS